MSKQEKIYVQIASYRDPELLYTIKDLLEKAKNPENLSIGVCWQHSKDDLCDDITFYKDDKRIKIIDIDYRESKGCCWARNKLQKNWNGEKYTLQIDSHMLFDYDWDEKLINYLKNCDSKKPIISCYPNPYFGRLDDNLSYDPSYMEPSSIDENGILSLQAYTICEEKVNPVRGKFLAAGFVFSYGEICRDCLYDPELYFVGEEMVFAARAFTHGYDIFHPPKNIIWHLYKVQENMDEYSFHWKDHVNNPEKEKNWDYLNEVSVKKIKELFGIDCERKENPEYGFGNERTFEEYQEFCGVNFSEKKIVKEPDFNYDWT